MGGGMSSFIVKTERVKCQLGGMGKSKCHENNTFMILFLFYVGGEQLDADQIHSIKINAIQEFLRGG